MKEKYINIFNIKEPVIADNYPKDLYDSIKAIGVLVPLVLTEDNYIIDGRGRYLAAKDACLLKIPCYILTEEEVKQSNEIRSVRSINTDPIEYAKALRRLITNNSQYSLQEIADRLGKSVEWIEKKLSLLE